MTNYGHNRLEGKEINDELYYESALKTPDEIEKLLSINDCVSPHVRLFIYSINSVCWIKSYSVSDRATLLLSTKYKDNLDADGADIILAEYSALFPANLLYVEKGSLIKEEDIGRDYSNWIISSKMANRDLSDNVWMMQSNEWMDKRHIDEIGMEQNCKRIIQENAFENVDDKFISSVKINLSEILRKQQDKSAQYPLLYKANASNTASNDKSESMIRTNVNSNNQCLELSTCDIFSSRSMLKLNHMPNYTRTQTLLYGDLSDDEQDEKEQDEQNMNHNKKSQHATLQFQRSHSDINLSRKLSENTRKRSPSTKGKNCSKGSDEAFEKETIKEFQNYIVRVKKYKKEGYPSELAAQAINEIFEIIKGRHIGNGINMNEVNGVLRKYKLSLLIADMVKPLDESIPYLPEQPSSSSNSNNMNTVSSDNGSSEVQSVNSSPPSSDNTLNRNDQQRKPKVIKNRKRKRSEKGEMDDDDEADSEQVSQEAPRKKRRINGDEAKNEPIKPIDP